MAGMAAGRRDVSAPWPGGDLAQVVGSRPCGVRGRMRVLKGTCAGMGGERACGCAAARRTDAEWLDGAVGVASACDGPRMQSQEWVSELKNDPGLAPSGWKGSTEGGALARRGGTPASSTSVERQRDERVGLYPFSGECVHVRGCMGVWMTVRVRACARRDHGHGDGRDHGGDTTTGRTSSGTRKEGPRPWLEGQAPQMG
jgi:hypothetical protein